MLMVVKPFYVSSTKSIQITSTVHRSQAQNIDDCLKKVCPRFFCNDVALKCPS